MLTEEQVKTFQENGFLTAIPALTPQETKDLRARLHDVLEGRTSTEPETKRNLLGDSERIVMQVVNIWEADELFRAHLYNPTICQAIARLTGSNTIRVWHDQIQYKPPRVGGPTRWHQDHPYWPIIQPADLVSAWLALEDADVENGCMWMVPRSHKWGPHKGGTIGTNDEDFSPDYDPSLIPDGEVVETIPCEVKAGEVMFHHCLTWHGSPPNNSERGRPAIAVHYMPGWTRYQPVGTHLIEKRVKVSPGEILSGSFFPVVWDHGPVSP